MVLITTGNCQAMLLVMDVVHMQAFISYGFDVHTHFHFLGDEGPMNTRNGKT